MFFLWCQLRHPPSGVGDRVDLRLAVLVPLHFSFVRGHKVTLGHVGLHRVESHRLQLGRLGLRDAVVLVRHCVRGFKLATERRMGRHTRHTTSVTLWWRGFDLQNFLLVLLNPVAHVAQLFNLVRTEGLLVAGSTAEGQRINGELRLLLNKHVLPIAPVWVQLLVVARGVDRGIVSLEHPLLGFRVLGFLPLEAVLECGVEVHLVWIDDFALLFQIEGLLVVSSGGVLLRELLLVVADGARRVGIAHKVVHATALPSDLCIACRQLLNYTRRY